MNKHSSTSVPTLPDLKLEPELVAALEEIRRTRDLTQKKLLAEINARPGPSPAARARSYVLDHYRSANKESFPQLAEDPPASEPFRQALLAVRRMKPPRG